MRRPRRLRRLRRLLSLAVPALALLVAAAWWASRPAEPDAFYAAAAPPASAPGMLLAQQPFTRGVPPGALAWRILYVTTDLHGAARQASAIVMVSAAMSSAARPVIAWTHGTTGVVPGCAPSLLTDPFANVPALRRLLDEGWIFVATDYAGLGTPGPHPYLVGLGEARSALDAVRAARRMQGLQAGAATVVWGHSQGGHAALWTGIVAPAYAPDVPLAGVAALAPASDLAALVDAVQDTPVGRIMTSFLLRAYAAAHPDVDFARTTGWRRPIAHDLSSRCLAGRAALFSVAEALLLPGPIFAVPPREGAFGARLAQHTPDAPIAAPLLIAQGLADDLVLPAVQAAFVARRCAAGQRLEFRRYAGRDHLSLVAEGSPLADDLVRWTHQRLAGTPVEQGCPAHDR